jgi:hypothetical protein
MQFEVLLLGLIVCIVTILPIGYVLARLVALFNAKTEDKHARLHGQIFLVGFSAVIFVVLYLFAHQDTFTGLDVACYRQLAETFSDDGRSFHDVDNVFQSIPSELRQNFLYRPKGRLTRDLIFELKDSSGSTDPFFLPMLSLGAAVFPDIDLFVPICGTLWFASLLAFGLCKGGKRGLLISVCCFFATFWPMWFLRGFHTDAVGAILVGVALLAALTPQLMEGRLNSFVVGFILGCSVGYHFTMVVPAGIVAVYLLLTKGWTFRRLLLLILGGALGLIPMLYQLIFICAPYGNVLSISSFVNMFANVREIRFLSMALLFAIIVFIGFAAIILNHKVQFWVHDFIDKHAAKINPLLIVIAMLIWIAYAFVAGSITNGFLTIQSGLLYVLPLIIFAGILLSISRGEGSVVNSALALLLTLMAALFIYLKGVEVHVGLWSQRRFFPVVVMFMPLLILALCSFKAIGKKKFLPIALFLISFVPIVRWPSAYFGVFDASSNEVNGSPSLTTVLDEFIDKYNDNGKAIFLFDYFPHSVPFQHKLNRCVLGVGEHAQWDYQKLAKWALETSKTNKSNAFFFSSYGVPKLEDGVALEPCGLVSDRFKKYTTKGVFPVARNEAKELIEIVGFELAHPTRSSIQIIYFDILYPFGLRQPWGKTTRHGTWSRQGSGIVGPIPEKGGKVLLTISAMWFAPVSDGSWQEQNLIIESPFGEKKVIKISADEKFGVYSCEMERQADDGFGDSLTGVYRFYVDKPYDPLEYGIKGFDNDLGVIFKRVSIKNVE